MSLKLHLGVFFVLVSVGIGAIYCAPVTVINGLNSGDIEGVTAGTGLSGGGVSGSVSLSLDQAVAPTWTSSHTFTNAVQMTTVTVSTHFLVAPPGVETLGATFTITANGCGTIKRVSADTAVNSSTTNTFTAPGAGNAGCVMYVCNSSTNTITLDDNTNFQAASSAANVALTDQDCMTVGSDGSVWRQLAATVTNN